MQAPSGANIFVTSSLQSSLQWKILIWGQNWDFRKWMVLLFSTYTLPSVVCSVLVSYIFIFMICIYLSNCFCLWTFFSETICVERSINFTGSYTLMTENICLIFKLVIGGFPSQRTSMESVDFPVLPETNCSLNSRIESDSRHHDAHLTLM